MKDCICWIVFAAGIAAFLDGYWMKTEAAREKIEIEATREKSANNGERAAGELETLTIEGIDYAFRWAPPGRFIMGSPESEESRWNDETQREVTFAEGFWLMETEVTQEMWESVTGDNPSYFKGARRPVERVSWNDCQAFIEKLQPWAPNGWRFSLPTEAQWEYACRAGTTRPYGENGSIDTLAWYSENTGVGTCEVGQKSPNAWGLRDMLGNVWEWCSDCYAAYLSDDETAQPGPDGGSYRSYRGGSWSSARQYCRSSFRGRRDPSIRSNNMGLRLALVRE